jgi:2'-5' RNA ligase
VLPARRACDTSLVVEPNWFIALPVPAGRFLSELAPPAAVRLFAPEDLHITVAFLGRVTPERAALAFDAAHAFALKSCEISLADVVALGNPDRPSAFSALLGDGREAVEDAIAATRHVLLSAAGAPPDLRPPLAHVTLARPQRRASPAQVADALSWARALDLQEPRCILAQLALFTWSGDRTTNLFQIAQSRPLSRGA